MIKYSLPENKPYTDLEGNKVSSTEDYYHRPCVYLEISAEQLKALTVGDDVEVRLKGKVKSLEMRERDEGKSRHEMDLEVSEISIPGKNVFTELLDDED